MDYNKVLLKLYVLNALNNLNLLNYKFNNECIYHKEIIMLTEEEEKYIKNEKAKVDKQAEIDAINKAASSAMQAIDSKRLEDIATKHAELDAVINSK